TIRGIIEATGVKIDVDDTGKVNVASSDADGLKRAIETISNLTAVPEVGKVYLGKVVRLAEFGAFVEIFPGTDGLLHISEIAEHRVHEVKDELNDGDQVLVKVLGIEGNRIKLSRKAVLKEQRIKLGLPDPNQGGGHVPDIAASSQHSGERQPSSNGSTIVLESGDDFDSDDDGNSAGEGQNFNRPEGGRSAGSPQSPGGRGPGGNNNRRRRRPGGGGGRPGGGGGRR
ncbi:MAG TPA: S1 RNA-binding domain-containing protein, partial [Acidobacteriaceae bacterium]|nr:S1 RNA-binding domain-containing protein [Acidobacteriaceae bacterium]